MTSQQDFRKLVEPGLRKRIRRFGIPSELRGQIWKQLIDSRIGDKYDTADLLEAAQATLDARGVAANCNNNNNNTDDDDEEVQMILKQIDLDVDRTMPGHKLFDVGQEGGIKLRRILVAYSVHVNREIAYCQGFNFIVALLLNVLDGCETKALRGFICIVEHIFPSKFYFDHYLTGARADQFLLADFICDHILRAPTNLERKMVEDVTSSITLNWFISLFHGVVPINTRLVIIDNFLLEGVKALFRFAIAILDLSFKVTPPSSNEVFHTIRTVARDLDNVNLLLGMVKRIKLPKESYFAIKRSFYMVQSSFNSDLFYIQSLNNESLRHVDPNKPLSLQQAPTAKVPAKSLIIPNTLAINNANRPTNHGSGGTKRSQKSPRVCSSWDKTKVCVQTLGKLGRSHIRVINVNVRSHERSLMSPLRNCLVIGISNCGRHIIMARRASKRGFKLHQEQDLTFHIHELCSELFDGFYLEEHQLALILTSLGELIKIVTAPPNANAEDLILSNESLLVATSPLGSGDHGLSDCCLVDNNHNQRLKLCLASLDPLTFLLWIYLDTGEESSRQPVVAPSFASDFDSASRHSESRFRPNNPFVSCDEEDFLPLPASYHTKSATTASLDDFTIQRRIIIVDIMSMDVFSNLNLHQSFGPIVTMRTCLIALCEFENPMSSQFSSRIVKIEPTGRYEHLLSFSDIVDFMITVPKCPITDGAEANGAICINQPQLQVPVSSQRYTTLRKFLPRTLYSLGPSDEESSSSLEILNDRDKTSRPSSSLANYCRKFLHNQHEQNGSQQTATDASDFRSPAVNSGHESDDGRAIMALPTDVRGQGLNQNHNRNHNQDQQNQDKQQLPQQQELAVAQANGQGSVGPEFVPMSMTFVFQNGKIALFEFTEPFVIRTRESQLDRYDYSRIIDISRDDNDCIVTILTIFEKLIKVVI